MEACPLCEAEFGGSSPRMARHVITHLKGLYFGSPCERIECWCGKWWDASNLSHAADKFWLHCQLRGGIFKHFLNHHLGIETREA